jgi:hypothetical protein
MTQSSPEGIILGKGSTLIKMEVSVSEKPKQETLEEAAERYATGKSSSDVFKKAHIRDFIEGAKWQQEQDKNKYSEEDMILYSDYVLMCSAEKTFKLPLKPKKWFKEIGGEASFMKAIELGAKWQQEQIYNQIKKLYAQCLDIIEQFKNK